MSLNDPMLAATETDWTKLIIGAAGLIIWLVSTAASSIAKRQADERRKRVRESIEANRPDPAVSRPRSATPREVTASLPTIPRVLIPTSIPKTARTPRQKTQKPVARAIDKVKSGKRLMSAMEIISAKARQAGAAAERPPVSSESAGARVATTAVARAAAGGVSPSASAASLRAWLRPSTLQRQFMLTEVLRPPVALRSDHLSDH